MTQAIASIVIGMQFGDEGKGAGVQRLSKLAINNGSYNLNIPKPTVIVRFNGSSQAGHNVTSSYGHHEFHQFGSGTLDCNAVTYLHKTFMVDPWALLVEAGDLGTLLDKPEVYMLAGMIVHRDAPLLLPCYGVINKLRELDYGLNAHGTCGKGVGVLSESILKGEEIITFREIRSLTISQLAEKIQAIVNRYKEEAFELADVHNNKVQINGYTQGAVNYYFGSNFGLDYANWLSTVFGEFPLTCDDDWISSRLNLANQHIVFEGAQGILLDEWRGFHPFTTWSSTNLRVVHQMFEDASFSGAYHSYGMVKAVMSRHGNGPFPTESELLTNYFNGDETHNVKNQWQGTFRRGILDYGLLEYALSVAADPDSKYRGIDSLQYSCVDHLIDMGHRVRLGYGRPVPINPNLKDLDFQTTTVLPFLRRVTKEFYNNPLHERPIGTPLALNEYIAESPYYSIPSISYLSNSPIQNGPPIKASYF